MRLKKKAAAIGIVAATSLASTAAWADNAVVDGDIATTGIQHTLTGEACVAGDGIHTSVLGVRLAVVKRGSGTNVFGAGETVTFSELNNSNTGTDANAGGLTTQLPSPATITIPADWASAANGTLSPVLTAGVAVTTADMSVGSTVTGTLAYRASGENQSSTTINRDTTGSVDSENAPLSVNAVVVDGATAQVEDCIAPTATITTPTDSQELTVGESATFDFGCADGVAGDGGAGASGIAETDGCVAEDGGGNVIDNGDTIDTTTVGTYSITVTATDSAGNFSAATHEYEVVAPSGNATFAVTNFFQPINDGEGLKQSAFKKGSTIPVKFAIEDEDGNRLSDELAAALAADCGAEIATASTGSGTSGVLEAANSNPANSGSCFRYDDVADQFVFNLGTKNMASGEWNITVDAGDYGTRSVTVSLR